MAVSDYDQEKSADVTSVTGTPTLTGFPAFIRIEGTGTDSTGTGVCTIDQSGTTIDGQEDIAVYDENGNLLDYHWERFDTSADVYELWVRQDITCDGSTQVKIAFGNGSTDESVSKATVWDSVPGLVTRYGFSESTLTDSTSNNNDESSSTGPTSRSDTVGEMGESYEFDGSDDDIQVSDSNSLDLGTPAVMTFFDFDDPGNNNVWLYAKGRFDNPTNYAVILSSSADPHHPQPHTNDGGSNINGTVSQDITAGVLHQSVLIYDGSNLDHILDGTNRATAATGNNNASGNSSNLAIGERGDDTEYFDGHLTEMQIYDNDKGNDWWEAAWDYSTGSGFSLFSWSGAQATTNNVTDTATTTPFSYTSGTTTEALHVTESGTTTSLSFTPGTTTEALQVTETGTTTSFSFTPRTTTETGKLTDTASTTSISFTPGTTTETLNITDTATTENFSFTPGTTTESLHITDTATTTRFTFTVQTSSETIESDFGTPGELEVYANGTQLESFPHELTIEKRLNEMDTFNLRVYGDDTDRGNIVEDNEIMVFDDDDDNNGFVFKGEFADVEYKSDFEIVAEGRGMEEKLLNRKTGRTEYTNTSADSIVSDVIDDMSIDTNEAAPNTTLRFDHDNKLRAVAEAADAVGYDWYISQKDSEDFATDYFNFVERQGSSSSVKTLDIGGDATLIQNDTDTENLANDITLLGRGDGINQLEARVHAASSARTTLKSITVEDKAHPIIISEGPGSGTGDCEFPTAAWDNVSDNSDIGVFDTDGNALDFEIEELDTANNTAVIWVFISSLVRDNTEQVKITLGSGSTDDSDPAGTWGNSGQDAELTYHLSEDSGDAIDSVGSNDGTVSGATQGVSGQFDGAYSFDATNDEITVDGWSYTNLQGTNPRTFTMWVKTAEIDGSIFKYGASSPGKDFVLRDNGAGDLQLALNAGREDWNDVGINDDSWHHLAVTYGGGDSSDIDLYVGGAREEKDSSANRSVDTGSNKTFSIQARPSNGFDEFKAYSGEKSPRWLQAEHDASPKGGQTLFSWKGAETSSGSYDYENVASVRSDGGAMTASSDTVFVDDTSSFGSPGDNVKIRVGTEVIDADIEDGTTFSVNTRGVDDAQGNSTEAIEHYDGIQVWLQENVTQGDGPFTPTENGAESGSSIADHGVVEFRDMDKTIIDKSTLEKVADNKLKNRREPVKKIQVETAEPRTSVSMGDTVTVDDQFAMSLNDEYRVVGIDRMWGVTGERTVLHCVNRPLRLIERLRDMERDMDSESAHMQGATNMIQLNEEDNADSSSTNTDFPLEMKFYLPDDAVQINKAEVAWRREPFRAYINQNSVSSNSQTSISLEGSDTDSGTNVSDGNGLLANVNVGSYGGSLVLMHYDVNLGSNAGGDNEVQVQLYDLDENDLLNRVYRQAIEKAIGSTGAAQGWIATEEDLENHRVELDVDNESGADMDYDITIEVFTEDQHTHNVLTSDSDYGLFTPSSESDVSVDIDVDDGSGYENVTTQSGVSVGDDFTPVDISGQIDESGQWYTVRLDPDDRCRLGATLLVKYFVESKV